MQDIYLSDFLDFHYFLPSILRAYTKLYTLLQGREFKTYKRREWKKGGKEKIER